MSIEGQRSIDGSLRPYQQGAASIAILTQTPIVGIVIHDSYELNPYGSVLVKPGTITYEVLPPLCVAEYTIHDKAQLTERLENMAQVMPRIPPDIPIYQ